jgi:simple sugar transport system permease protein
MAVATPSVVFGISVALSAIALMIPGYNPITAFSAMVRNVLSVSGLVTVSNFAARYYVMGVAVAIGFKMSLFNIGTNGQYQVAALFAGAAGGSLSFAGPLNVALVIAIAMICGAFWAVIPAVLFVSRNVNIVVGTIMMNGIAAGLIGYFLRTWFRDFDDNLTAHTKTIPPDSRLPTLNSLLELFGIDVPKSINLHSFILISILVGVLFHFVIYQTRFGYDILASGRNAAAARASGVDAGRMVTITMAISGALAGLAGMSVLLNQAFEYGDRFPLQLGFTGISVALLGRNSPSGIALAAIVLASIEQGSRGLAVVGVPQEIGQILQGTLLVVAVVAYEVTSRRARTRAIQQASNQSERQGFV